MFNVHPFGRPFTRALFVRLEILIALFFTIAFLLMMFGAAPAHAQTSTTFLTDKSGQIPFPFLPPNRATGAPGSINNMTIGQTTPAPGNFSTTTKQQAAAFNTNIAATLTSAQMVAGIITSTPASAIAITLPLATAMDTGLPASVALTSFDFAVADLSSTAANTITMTTNTGWTLVGNMVLTPLTTGGVSGQFRAVKTAAGAWTLYRLS